MTYQVGDIQHDHLSAGPCCDASLPNANGSARFWCTLEAGHIGTHAAAGLGGRILRVWNGEAGEAQHG